MQETRVLVETRGTTGKETTSYWFDLPIDVAEFEEKLGVGAESQDYRITEKVLPFADEVHEHTSVYQLNELDFLQTRQHLSAVQTSMILFLRQLFLSFPPWSWYIHIPLGSCNSQRTFCLNAQAYLK